MPLPKFYRRKSRCKSRFYNAALNYDPRPQKYNYLTIYYLCNLKHLFNLFYIIEILVCDEDRNIFTL